MKLARWEQFKGEKAKATDNVVFQSENGHQGMLSNGDFLALPAPISEHKVVFILTNGAIRQEKQLLVIHQFRRWLYNHIFFGSVDVNSIWKRNFYIGDKVLRPAV